MAANGAVQWLGQIPGKFRERAVGTGSNDVDKIYQRMAVIRRELHTNVRDSVAGAEAMADWGRYTWTYPWIVLGAAAAVGYLVYAGSRRKCADDTASQADGAKADETVAHAAPTKPERSRAGRNLLFVAWEILLPVAVIACQNYALHWLEQGFTTRTVHRTNVSPVPGRGRGRMDAARR